MRKKHPYNYLNIDKIIHDNKIYRPTFKWRLEDEQSFITGKRMDGLTKLFRPKGKAARSPSGYTFKLLIEIGIQELKLKTVKKTVSKNGNNMMLVEFHKSPTPSWYRITEERYDTIKCFHLLNKKGSDRFHELWYRPFSNELSYEQFKNIKQASMYKCVIKHKEELWKQKGQVMTYAQGHKMGEPIVLLKPEVVAVYPIGTPDKEIKINYFRLYEPFK